MEDPKPAKPYAPWEWERELPGYQEELQPLVEAWARGDWDELEAVATNVEKRPLVRLFAVHPLFDRELDHNNRVWDRPKLRQYRFHKLISDIAPTVVGPERTCLMRISITSKDHIKNIDGSIIWSFIDSHILKKNGDPVLFNWLWMGKLNSIKRIEHPTSWYLQNPIVILKNWDYFSTEIEPGITRIDDAFDENIDNLYVKDLKPLLKNYRLVFKKNTQKFKIIDKAIKRLIKRMNDEANMEDQNL